MELMSDSALLGHDEEALVQAGEVALKRKEDEPVWRNSDGVAYAKQIGATLRVVFTGDFQQAMLEPCRYLCSPSSASLRRAEYAARLHDGARSRVLLGEAAAAGPMDPAQLQRSRYFLTVAAQDWSSAATAARAYGAALRAGNAPVTRLGDIQVATRAMPLLAIALAQAGDFKGAHAAIDATPDDCYLCLRMRGAVAVQEKNWGGAQYWVARAVAAAPSLPAAYADWGAMLLVRGDAAGAAAKFALANQKGPHFADALEGWGEALIAQNRSDLAAAKFARAAKYAPRWKRLHQQWALALGNAGKTEAAKAEFAIAASL
jgi:hypothetical protein